MIDTRCGYVAIVGRPNVGKSTLMNAILGQKVSITCHKRQTTRHTIHGIKTEAKVQAIYVDTPGIHKSESRALNRYMNKTASTAIFDVDVIMFVIDATTWTDEDSLVLKQVKKSEHPVILVVNKIDEIKEQEKLLPLLESLSEKMDFADIVPVSARQQKNIDALEKAVNQYLPSNPFFFDEDQITDSNDAFLVSETIREKLFFAVHQEIPYSAAVAVDQMKTENAVLHIYATIYVDKKGQKNIIIGKGGSKIKDIGKRARMDLEKMFDAKIFLRLWVKVKEGWVDSEHMTQRLHSKD